TELTIAFTLCKGIGYALTAKAWSDWFSEVDIYRFSSGVTALCCVFPLLLLAAKLHLFWLYAAYIVYGVMQAGSELSWNMSGPVFSRHENSSLFSSVNVLTVGLRGCFAPALGTSLLYWTSPGFVI